MPADSPNMKLRTNFRLTGKCIDYESASALTILGAAKLIPCGYLGLSACCLQLFVGNRFICFEASVSTGA